jgi:hypothetical protein
LASEGGQEYGQDVRDRELKRKAKVAEILLAAARQLAEGLEPERVYERFQELLATVIQHDGLVVSSYDDLDDVIRCEYVWNEGSKVDPSTALPGLQSATQGEREWRTSPVFPATSIFRERVSGLGNHRSTVSCAGGCSADTGL